MLKSITEFASFSQTLSGHFEPCGGGRDSQRRCARVTDIMVNSSAYTINAKYVCSLDDCSTFPTSLSNLSKLRWYFKDCALSTMAIQYRRQLM